MAFTRTYAGICGFVTEVRATSGDGRHVRLKVASGCPDIIKIKKDLEAEEFDAYEEIGPCAQPGSMYDTKLMAICGRLPHVACPVPTGICKAMEVAARLALPRHARIEVYRGEGPEKEPPGED
jgi:hypothetical protein